jgi:hypothetical protein
VRRLAVALAVIALAGVSGCGGDDKPDSATTPTISTETQGTTEPTPSTAPAPTPTPLTTTSPSQPQRTTTAPPSSPSGGTPVPTTPKGDPKTGGTGGSSPSERFDAYCKAHPGACG